jgi:deazaflavin-dependent oxidoreductase (nitroreductase family)
MTTDSSAAHRTPVSRGVRVANRVITLLLRAGVPVGPMQVLTVAGRRSGQPRRTPVTPVPVGGERYLVQAFSGADWAKNARAAGWGNLGRGRHQDRVRLVELDTPDRAAVLRELPRVAGRAAGIFVRNGIADAPTPEAFAAAAPRCVVFKVAA